MLAAVAGARHDRDLTIVFATGFDAMTGPLLRPNITGRDGRALAEHWADGPRSYLGPWVRGLRLGLTGRALRSVTRCIGAPTVIPAAALISPRSNPITTARTGAGGPAGGVGAGGTLAPPDGTVLGAPRPASGTGRP